MIPSPLLQPPHKTSWKYTLFNRLIWNHLMNTFSVIFDTATLCFVWFCAEFRSFLFIWEKKENTARADITFQYRRIGGWLSTRCSQLSFQLFSFKKFSMLCFQNHIWIYPEVNTDFTGDLENGSFDLLWLFSPLSLSLLSPSQHVLLSQSHAILLLLSSLQAFSLSS